MQTILMLALFSLFELLASIFEVNELTFISIINSPSSTITKVVEIEKRLKSIRFEFIGFYDTILSLECLSLKIFSCFRRLRFFPLRLRTLSSQNVNYNSSKPYLLEDICYPKKTILRMTNIKFYYNVNTILSFYKLSVHLYEKIQIFYG